MLKILGYPTNVFPLVAVLWFMLVLVFIAKLKTLEKHRNAAMSYAILLLVAVLESNGFKVEKPQPLESSSNKKSSL